MGLIWAQMGPIWVQYGPKWAWMGRAPAMTLLINKVLVGAQLEFDVLLAPRRVAVSWIDFCDTLFVGIKDETASEDISRALTPLIYLVVKALI